MDMEAGNWEAAITKFNQSLKITPEHAQIYGNLGICYASIGKIQIALDSFDRALAIDPHYEPALLNRELVKLLEEGQCLTLKLKSIDYYKDYSQQNGAYIREYARDHKLIL